MRLQDLSFGLEEVGDYVSISLVSPRSRINMDFEIISSKSLLIFATRTNPL